MIDVSNPLARLIAFCARHEDDVDAQWIEAACWRHVRDGEPLHRCLGIANPHGGATWRDKLRTERRDGLLRAIYQVHFRPLSLHAASWKIATDYALFKYRLWPKLMFGEMPRAFVGSPSATYFRLMAEDHDVPAQRQLFNILRKAIVLPVSNGLDAVSPHDDRPDPAGETAKRAIDPPRPIPRAAATG